MNVHFSQRIKFNMFTLVFNIIQNLILFLLNFVDRSLATILMSRIIKVRIAAEANARCLTSSIGEPS